ncbi:MAG: DUF2589 domain-containing protein [Colwellia sp.]|nr:DUF2589 domain-containing protein [Colwellia sp.]
MIRFQALMHAVQQSIHSAAQAVESAGFKHIDKFFDKVTIESPSDINSSSNNIIDVPADEIDKSANNNIKENNLGTDEHQSPEGEVIYRPKMVAMAFPSQGPDGVTSTIVNVPLITLCPISSPRIKDVKFSADLEVTADDSDELYVAFRSPQVTGGEHTITKDCTNTRIEISLVGHEPPEGLQKIIEGYEKALRAQIPG